jgi:hypothetical protein
MRPRIPPKFVATPKIDDGQMSLLRPVSPQLESRLMLKKREGCLLQAKVDYPIDSMSNGLQPGTGVILSEVAAGQLSGRLFGPRGHGVEESLRRRSVRREILRLRVPTEIVRTRFPKAKGSGRSAQNDIIRH